VTSKGKLLCVHSDIAQLQHRKLLLEENGYIVATACSKEDAVRLLKSEAIDAVVVDYIDDSLFVPKQIKQVRPRVQIVVVANKLDLPGAATDSADALVASFDGPQFLLDTLHFLLQVKPNQLPINTQSDRQRFADSIASAWRDRVRR